MFEKVFVQDIRAGQEIESPFLLSDIRLGQTKGGKPYVGLKLKDRSGELEGRVWDGAEEFFKLFASGDVALVKGVADSYQNQVQIKVIYARPMDPLQVDPAQFMPASRRDPREMYDRLLALARDLSNPHLRDLLLAILEDPDLAESFKRSTAAKRFHHAYAGGLLEHTLSVAEIASVICGFYPQLNRDLLVAGAILHDLGKIREFDQGLVSDYTDEGRLLGHLIIGLYMLEEKIADLPDFPQDLALLIRHMIISHHGEYELGSPKKPKILEALVLHALDDLDAKLNAVSGYIENHLDERTGWTEYNRLMARFFFRPELPEWPVASDEVDRTDMTDETGRPHIEPGPVITDHPGIDDRDEPDGRETGPKKRTRSKPSPHRLKSKKTETSGRDDQKDEQATMKQRVNQRNLWED